MWDIALDNRTGDFMFTAARDLAGIGGEGHVVQRIMTRLRIRRGSFVYDQDGDLGSRLDTMASYTPDRIIREAPALIREALAPMTDIEISDVALLRDSENETQTHARISYRIIGLAQAIENTVTVPIT